MQLEDVERLEKLKADVAATAAARAKPTTTRGQSFFERHMAMLRAEEAYRSAMLRASDALLALAREALERRRDAEAASDDGAALSAQLHEMMRDPRYWRDRDPEHVARVTAGFRKLFPG